MRAIAVPTDVTVRAEIDNLVKSTVDAFGRVDVLAYIAGIGSTPSLCDSTDEEIARVFDVNLVGCARAMHAVLPVMKAQRSGAIVNIGSIAGEAGVMGVSSASKFGVRGLSDTVRREVRADGIRGDPDRAGLRAYANERCDGRRIAGPGSRGPTPSSTRFASRGACALCRSDTCCP